MLSCMSEFMSIKTMEIKLYVYKILDIYLFIVFVFTKIRDHDLNNTANKTSRR